jgi:hypothetical protein
MSQAGPGGSRQKPTILLVAEGVYSHNEENRWEPKVVGKGSTLLGAAWYSWHLWRMGHDTMLGKGYDRLFHRRRKPQKDSAVEAESCFMAWLVLP